MSSGPVLNPYNLRPPYLPNPLVDAKTGTSTAQMDRWLRDLTTIIGYLAQINVAWYGARGDGRSDDTVAFQTAVTAALNQGGGVINIPSGKFKVNSIFTPVGSTPIVFNGQGESTVILRGSNLADGKGLLDISGSNVTLQNLMIDGQVTVPVGLQYGVDFNGITTNDPMATSLTKNTSVWVHGPVSGFSMYGVKIQHSGGYAVLIDCLPGGIFDVDIINCIFMNNRPSLFGLVPGQLIYGSWNGGIYVNGDGRTSGSGVLRGLNVTQCHFHRNTGNCIWSHLYGLNALHDDMRITNNHFIDCGLDGVLVGGVTGGIVSECNFRRVGYVTLDDTSPAIPRWLPNYQATALDSSGLVKGVNYEDNSFLSINGGCLDLDGHGDSVISGNTCRVPYSDEPEYNEDSIAISGPTNSGAESYGLNLGNTQNTPYGGRWVNVNGNNFINLSGGSIRLYAARDCLVEGNSIVSPDAPVSPPIIGGPGGAGANQRMTGNVIRNNRFQYNPAIAAPFVYEDNTIAPFTAADVNYVFDNYPIVGSDNAFEFQPNAASGSQIATAAVAGAATLKVTRGVVTSEALTTAAGSAYTLTLTNPQMRTSSNVFVTVSNGTNTGGAAILQSAVSANGSIVIKVLNAGGSAFNGTLLIRFSIQ